MSKRLISHHPNNESLAAYAAGGMDEARAVVIATHLTLCDECAAAVRDFETVGGAVLEELEPIAMATGALADFWSRAGASDIAIGAPSTRPANDFDLTVAQPLQRYLNTNINDVTWRPVAPGLSQHVIQAEGYRPGVLRLLKIMPGTQIPKHTHKDDEYTLILRGAYEDVIGEFGPGDFADLSGEHTHAPRATGDEPCICLIATAAPLEFKTAIGKVFQPFIGL
ncbi:MAG: ChrR family anti-sigma-E factor [Pseudomonadota bacterium]